MIKRITIRDVASYDKEGVTFDDLAKVNIIYGGNGTGKTTLSRVLDGLFNKRKKEPEDLYQIVELANGKVYLMDSRGMLIDKICVNHKKKEPSYKRCKIDWEGRPMEVLIYNQDFKQRNLIEEMPGVFTIGGDLVKLLNQQKKWFKRKKRIENTDPRVYTEEGLREVNSLDDEDLDDDEFYSVEPAVININKILKQIGFTGFRITKAKQNPFSYQLIRNDGSEAGETLSEGEVTIITFLYFMQLVYGGHKNDESVNAKVVVIDDPISSLDSNVMFVVSEMVRRMMDSVRGRKESSWRMPEFSLTMEPMGDVGFNIGWKDRGVKQVIVLTHNVYFHRLISERTRRADTHYWKLSKRDGMSKLTAFGEENPIRSEYELLWGELRRLKEGEYICTGIQNVMRRIIETYFVVMGGYNKRKLIPENFSDDNEEMTIVTSLAKWADEGSHMAGNDLYLGSSEEMAEKYLRVFKRLFVKLGHEAHYNMMMRVKNT